MNKTSRNTRLQTLGSHAVRLARHLFLHNGWLKLAALIISIVIWAGLVSQDNSLTRDKAFQNVSVSVTGTDTMRRNGFIVTSDLDEVLRDISCVAAVPQQQYENAEASAYNIRLDLSRVTTAGEQELKITSSASATYGRVTSITPATVTVNTEEYILRQRIPVTVSITGDAPEGWYLSSPYVSPSLISVSGPKSLVQTISRARVFLSPEQIDWEEGTMIVSSELALFNRNGDEVDRSLLEMTTDSVLIDSAVVEATVLPQKTFETAEYVTISGAPADGYEVKDIRIIPESVHVAARSEVLSQVNELMMENNTISLKNLEETTVFQLKVQKPSEDAVVSNETVTVTVEIAQAEE